MAGQEAQVSSLGRGGTPDPEADSRQRVALAYARVARFDGPFADARVRRALALAQAYARAAAPAAALAAAVRLVEQAADEAGMGAEGSVWTLTEARRTAAAAGEYRAAREVADVLGRALDPVGCLLRPTTALALDPAQLTTTVAALARVVARAGPVDLFPILADALEDAGCADPVVLRHCRGPGPHVPGCWVLGLILGEVPGTADTAPTARKGDSITG
ncbi:MAG: hypothetical protein JWO38_3277 [Gemmataceae bacterium]|nr:hypothetical protein [Gemmataceae bacterium]